MAVTNGSPGWPAGFVPTAEQWAAAFAAKVDAVGGQSQGLTLSPTVDWMTPLIEWPVPYAQSTILSQDGKIALTLGSRTSDLDPNFGSQQITIGVASFAINDTTNRFLTCWAFYGEARNYPDSEGQAFCCEFDAINLNTAPTNFSTPYKQEYGATPIGIWMASGGGVTDLDAQCAYAVVNNGAKFWTGISFGATALTGCDGVDGFGQAMALAKGHTIQWYAAGGAFDFGQGTASIVSTITSAAAASALQFQDGGVVFLGPQNQIDFSVQTVANAVNGLSVLPTVTGATPQLLAIGSDSDIPILIKPKGTGAILTAAPIIFTNAMFNELAGISSSVTTSANLNTLTFSDAGPFFFSQKAGPAGIGGTIFAVSIVVDSVNYVRAQPAATGVAPGIYATGMDTDVSLGLFPQGAGSVLVGNANFQRVGFNGTANIAKPTVTGSKGANAALGSLMSALSTYGLVLDSTS